MSGKCSHRRTKDFLGERHFVEINPDNTPPQLGDDRRSALRAHLGISPGGSPFMWHMTCLMPNCRDERSMSRDVQGTECLSGSRQTRSVEPADMERAASTVEECRHSAWGRLASRSVVQI